MTTPHISAVYKVHLPGEAPWARCLVVNDDGTWEGSIENNLVGELHDYQQGQVVKFRKDENARWVAVESEIGNA